MKPMIDIQRLAALARLALTPEESARLEADMTALIAFADQLDTVSDTELSGSEQGLPPALREDEPSDFPGRAAMLAAAKTTHGGYVTVPRVLED